MGILRSRVGLEETRVTHQGETDPLLELTCLASCPRPPDNCPLYAPLLWSFPLSCRIFPQTNIIFLNHISWNHFKSSLLLTLGPSTEDKVKKIFLKGTQWHTKQLDRKWMTTWGQLAPVPLKLYFSKLQDTVDSGAQGSGFKLWLCHFLAGWLCANYSPWLSFPMYEIRIMLLTTT